METTTVQLSDDIRSLGISNIDQYTGLWMVEPIRFQQTLGLMSVIDMKAHVAAARQADVSTSYEVIDDAYAAIAIRGVMTKQGSSMSSDGSTVIARRKISQAANDPRIKGILLTLETPGGTSAGTQELANAIALATSIKPVVSVIEDIGASAGYYAGSQATKVFANEPAVVGSIGTFLVVSDYSKAASDAGIVVHVIRAGEFKGAGTPGTQITDEQLSHWQLLINQQNELFLTAVARGRHMSYGQVKSLADGRVHIAAEAVKLGLIDGIATVNQALGELKQLASQRSKELRMSEIVATEPIQPKAATIQELRSAIVVPASMSQSHDAFVLKCLERNLTLSQAKDEWQIEIATALEASEKARAEAEAKATAAEASVAAMPGLAQSVGTTPDAAAAMAETNPLIEWRQALDDKCAKGVSRDKATITLAKERPELLARVQAWSAKK